MNERMNACAAFLVMSTHLIEYLLCISHHRLPANAWISGSVFHCIYAVSSFFFATFAWYGRVNISRSVFWSTIVTQSGQSVHRIITRYEHMPQVIIKILFIGPIRLNVSLARDCQSYFCLQIKTMKITMLYMRWCVVHGGF